MSLTGSQVARCNNAISAARAHLAELPGAGFTLFPTREERAAQSAAETLEAVEAVYRFWIDSEEPASDEVVAEIVTNAGGLTADFVQELAEAQITVGDVVEDEAPAVLEGLANIGKVLIVVAVIAGLAYALNLVEVPRGLKLATR